MSGQRISLQFKSHLVFFDVMGKPMKNLVKWCSRWWSSKATHEVLMCYTLARKIIPILQIFLCLSSVNFLGAWKIAYPSWRMLGWGVLKWYAVGSVELGIMYMSYKIGGSIIRELLLLKKIHFKSTQFKRRPNFHGKCC